MPECVCVINLSAPEIQIAVLVDNQLQDVNLSLPWEIGFRQENEEKLVACFGNALEQLDPNHPTEVLFRALDVHFKEITDEETLQCLFDAFFDEIFHQQLPEHRYLTDAMSVYAITPYQWPPTHRQQLRQALKRVKSKKQILSIRPSTVTLRGVFSQILCLSAYYQATWLDMLAGANSCHSFLIEFARNDFVVYQMICSQLEDTITVELTDMLRFTDSSSEIETTIAGVQKALQKVEDEQPVVVGFSGRIDDDDDLVRTIIESLQARCSATFLQPRAMATLLGGTELVRQFEEARSEKPVHFIYHFCYGVRLPDGKWVELAPKTWTAPYHRKKAFRITGSPETFDIPLFCGLSLTNNSDVHHIATLEIEYPEDNDFSSHNAREFIISITLNDSRHGTFSVHFPNLQEPKSVDFMVPVLMD